MLRTTDARDGRKPPTPANVPNLPRLTPRRLTHVAPRLVITTLVFAAIYRNRSNCDLRSVKSCRAEVLRGPYVREVATARVESPAAIRAWGFVLLIVLFILLYRQLWLSALWVAMILAFHLLAVRITLCRVETRQHRPCRWRVRGFLNTCDYHTDLKHGIPVFIYSGRSLTMPALIWPRHEVEIAGSPERQPSAMGGHALAPAPKSTSYDVLLKWLTIVGVCIAFASFIRDLIAG